MLVVMMVVGVELAATLPWDFFCLEFCDNLVSPILQHCLHVSLCDFAKGRVCLDLNLN